MCIFRALIAPRTTHCLWLYKGNKGSCLFCSWWYLPGNNRLLDMSVHIYPCRTPRRMVENIETPDLSPSSRLCVWKGGLSCRNPDDDCTAPSVSKVNKLSSWSHDLKFLANLGYLTNIFELNFVLAYLNCERSQRICYKELACGNGPTSWYTVGHVYALYVHGEIQEPLDVLRSLQNIV